MPNSTDDTGAGALIRIVAIGNHGDGVGFPLLPAASGNGPPSAGGDATIDEGADPIYVPFAAPGDVWRLTDDGAATCVAASEKRATPICPHFTICGGCLAQHLPEDAYLAWKQRRVVDALSAHGLSPDFRPPISCGPGSRRRAVFTVARAAGRSARASSGVALGFHVRGSDTLVDIDACPVMVPAIADRLATLKAVASAVMPSRGELRLTVIASDHGLDVSIDGPTDTPSAETRATLAGLAEAGGITRLVIAGEDIAQFAPPAVAVDGDLAVVPPSGAFLQAAASAEAEMIRLIRDATGRAKTIADLFCGVGAFALALARSAKVTARDSDAQAIAALTAAHNAATGLKPVDAAVRDLFREPLSRKELEPFDAVVFDPPRAGAKAQAEMLARSDVPVVVAVSCNPSTFGRDARILIEGGYTLGPVQPIDQFVFSEHVELVATFSKPRPKRRPRRR